jgi:hypothetical protein
MLTAIHLAVGIICQLGEEFRQNMKYRSTPYNSPPKIAKQMRAAFIENIDTMPL